MSKSLSIDSDSLVVSARGLRKNFGAVLALDGLDLQVRPGEVHGFLGPNGAGKSTTIRAILGQLRLTGGDLTVFGMRPGHHDVPIHARLAYVPGDTALWPGLTGGECIDLLGRFQGRHDLARRAELLERFELDPTRRARTYSKGNRQKVALVAALSTGADLFLLDEPTSGLDPLMEARFQEVVRQLRADGRTVLLSSHILDEVEALCDRVTIIRGGRTVSSGTLTQLRASTRTTIEVTTRDRMPAPQSWPGVALVHEQSREDGVRTALTVAADQLIPIVERIVACRPSGLVVRPPSLDEVFLEHYRDAS